MKFTKVVRNETVEVVRGLTSGASVQGESFTMKHGRLGEPSLPSEPNG
jgi:hypothetical protein